MDVQEDHLPLNTDVGCSQIESMNCVSCISMNEQAEN